MWGNETGMFQLHMSLPVEKKLSTAAALDGNGVLCFINKCFMLKMLKKVWHCSFTGL